jgi:hypothetical protein
MLGVFAADAAGLGRGYPAIGTRRLPLLGQLAYRAGMVDESSHEEVRLVARSSLPDVQCDHRWRDDEAMGGDPPTRPIDVGGLLVDIDGVLVTSWQPIPGAAEALAACHTAGMALPCLTNTTSVSRVEISHRLNTAGVAIDTSEIMSAPAATAAW